MFYIQIILFFNSSTVGRVLSGVYTIGGVKTVHAAAGGGRLGIKSGLGPTFIYSICCRKRN